MNANDLINMVEWSIEAADKGETILPKSVLAIRGHGSYKVSVFLNHLCKNMPFCQYLEFGTFTGRSLVAAAFGNHGSYIGVDKLQWLGSTIRFDSMEQLKDTLTNNLKLIHQGPTVPTYKVLEMDYHNFPSGAMSYDVFFYDADHSYQGTKDGIEKILPHLKPGVLIVDDYTTHAKSKEIQSATHEILDNAIVHKEWTLSAKQGWHTGLFVAVIG